MIQASDIEKIIALPGGVEIQYRGDREGEGAYRPTVELTFDWLAAQHLCIELSRLCTEKALK